MIDCIYPSPVGDLYLSAHSGRLVGLRFGVRLHLVGTEQESTGKDHDPVLDTTRQQLDEYFAGERKKFNLPLALAGTPFQLRIWADLQRIRYGQTISYGQLAQRVGQPGASRAVGSANGANPIAIVVPCHRVIASDGSLGGFSGGLEVKRELLSKELTHAKLFADAM